MLQAVHSKVQRLPQEVDITFNWPRNSLFQMPKV